MSQQSQDPIEANHILTDNLIKLKSQLVAVLANVRQQHQENEMKLKEMKNKSFQGKISVADFQYGYYKCGAPFFKDLFLQPAPYNDDYLRRKGYGEFFPFELPETSYWKLRQKTALLEGVKKQMIEHMKSQQIQSVSANLPNTRNKKGKVKSISLGLEFQKMSLKDVCTNIDRNYPNFAINWDKIGFDELNSEHQAIECMGIWNSYLRPDLNKGEWTNSENELLVKLVVEHKNQNWEAIAAQIPNRSSLQCFIQYQVNLDKTFPSDKWTSEEDEALINSVNENNKYGVIDWIKVSQSLPSRTKTQCYNRYFTNALRPDIKKGAFTAEENEIILDYVKNSGEDFIKMDPNLLPNRTIVQIRNHYNFALKNLERPTRWTADEDEFLIKFVEKHGTNNWKALADELKTHGRIACRTRYITIKKHLEKDPGSVRNIPTKSKYSKRTVSKANSNFVDGKHHYEVLDVTDTSNVMLKIRNDFPRIFHNFNISYNLWSEYNREAPAEDSTYTNQKILAFIKLLQADFSGFNKKTEIVYKAEHVEVLNEIKTISLPDELSKSIATLTQTPGLSFYIPPNYDTIVGLRGIALKHHFRNEVISPKLTYICGPVTDQEKHDNAVKLFKQRFFQLFYLPALLSKIKVENLSYRIKEEPEHIPDSGYSAVQFILDMQKNNMLSPQDDDEEDYMESNFYGEPSSKKRKEEEN